MTLAEELKDAARRMKAVRLRLIDGGWTKVKSHARLDAGDVISVLITGRDPRGLPMELETRLLVDQARIHPGLVVQAARSTEIAACREMEKRPA